jgi:hypothetical protein
VCMWMEFDFHHNLGAEDTVARLLSENKSESHWILLRFARRTRLSGAGALLRRAGINYCSETPPPTWRMWQTQTLTRSGSPSSSRLGRGSWRRQRTWRAASHCRLSTPNSIRQRVRLCPCPALASWLRSSHAPPQPPQPQSQPPIATQPNRPPARPPTRCSAEADRERHLLGAALLPPSHARGGGAQAGPDDAHEYVVCLRHVLA